MVYGKTADFKTLERDARGYAKWPAVDLDGLISPWREGDHLFLFAGKYVQMVALPV